jgi:hypothetical protein
VSGDERALEADVTPGSVPDVLMTGDLEILGLLPNASNDTFLARATRGDEALLAVYKPRRGEAPLWDFPDGTLCVREVAAYVVACELGWPNVPPTVLRDGPAGPGSVQRFVEFDPSQHYFTLEGGGHDDAFRRIALFDALVNNADRKGGHCLLASDGRIWVVDHGVCFSEEPKLRTVIWAFIGEPIPDELLEDLHRLRPRLAAGPARQELERLLSDRELGALVDRLDDLVAGATFPEPGSDRPYPWPPV